MRYVEKHGRDRQATDDNVIRRVRFACWMPKAADTHSEYAIHTAFPRQQWLNDHVSMLRCTVPTRMLPVLSDLPSVQWSNGFVGIIIISQLEPEGPQIFQKY